MQGEIPLQCNLKELNYISFTKGCYLGQELTARTNFKARKAILGVVKVFFLNLSLKARATTCCITLDVHA